MHLLLIISFNPLTTAQIFDFRFCTFRGLSRAGLIQAEQMFHDAVACTCECAGIECQLLSPPRWDVTNCWAQASKFCCFRAHYRAVVVRVKESMAVSTCKGDRYEAMTTSWSSSLQPVLGRCKLLWSECGGANQPDQVSQQGNESKPMDGHHDGRSNWSACESCHLRCLNTCIPPGRICASPNSTLPFEKF